MADQPTWNPQTVAITDDALAGQTVVITGTLASMERKDAELLVGRAGGNATGSLSGKTNLLVAGEKAGSKLKKAHDLGVEVIDEAAFLERLGIELP
jgi:DNA ligase (NAD+)